VQYFLLARSKLTLGLQTIEPFGVPLAFDRLKQAVKCNRREKWLATRTGPNRPDDLVAVARVLQDEPGRPVTQGPIDEIRLVVLDGEHDDSRVSLALVNVS